MSILKCVKCKGKFEGDQLLVCNECYKNWFHNTLYQYYVKLEDSYYCLCNKHLNFDVEKCSECTFTNPGSTSSYSYMNKEIFNYVSKTRFLDNEPTEKIVNRLFNLKYQGTNKSVIAYYPVHGSIFESIVSESSNHKLLLRLFELRKPEAMMEVNNTYDQRLISHMRELNRSIGYCKNEDVYRIITYHLDNPKIIKEGNKKYIYDNNIHMMTESSNSKLLMKFLRNRLWERKQEKESDEEQDEDNNYEYLKSYKQEESKQNSSCESEIGKIIKNKRDQAGLTKTEVEQMAGLSTGHIGKIEIGVVPNPLEETINKISSVLDSENSTSEKDEDQDTEFSDPRDVIKYLRTDNCLSRGELGKLSGLHPGTLYKIEKKRIPSGRKVAMRLGDVFRIDWRLLISN